MLLEDVPGTGKTSLARALAATVQGTNTRIQFTPDLLPSDVTGVTIYDQKTQKFEFHQGPIFANIVLADEINRASPKTQSALLEVMEEARVTVDGATHEVGRPFMVIATQNPIEQAGTYRLPEAQLDRFLIKTSIGYPDHASTVQLLGRRQPQGPLQRSHRRHHHPGDRRHGRPRRHDARRHRGAGVHLPALRGDPHRAGDPPGRLRPRRPGHGPRRQGLGRRQGRNFVLPDDVKDLAAVVWTHRLVMDPEAEFAGATAEAVLTRVLAEVAAPQQRAAVS